MLDMGWTEILVIGVVALIVVGPKDLPRMLRTLGQYAGKVRGMAREFQRSIDDAAREADLAEFKDIKKGIDDVRAIGSDAARAVQQGVNRLDKEIEKSADVKEAVEAADLKDALVDETPINAPPDPIPMKAPETPPAAVESTAPAEPAAPVETPKSGTGNA